MSIATVNQLYNYTTSRDQHAFLPVLTTYIETDHKWQDIPPTTNQQGANVNQTTFNIPTTLGELLGTMILRFDIVIASGALAAAANNYTLVRLTRFLALRAINQWIFSHQGRTIDQMANRLDLLRIYYNLFCDDKTFMDTLHFINGDRYWDTQQINDLVCDPTPAGAPVRIPNINVGDYTNTGYHTDPNYIDHYQLGTLFHKELKGNKCFYIGGADVVAAGAVGVWPNGFPLSAYPIQNYFFVSAFAAGAHTVTLGATLTIPVQIVIPWWGGWRTNNVLPIRNLNSQPRLDIYFNTDLTNCLIDNMWDYGNAAFANTNYYAAALAQNPDIVAGITSINIQNPMLRCLYYRIPENIFATDFAFADQKNWIKPDWQTFQQDGSFKVGQDNTFYVNTINQDVRSLVVMVRHLSDIAVSRLDNFIGSDYIKTISLKHGNEYIGPRFPIESPYLLKYLKKKFYSNNTLDRNMDVAPAILDSYQAVPAIDGYNNEQNLAKEEVPIYAFCFGMSGDINQPGMGSINFNDLLQNLTLTITTTSKPIPANDLWRVDVYALTNNIVTYDKGELMRQL